MRTAGAVPAPAPSPEAAARAAFPGGAWRVTLETPAMLDALPCYLTAHPNQRFTPGVGALAGGAHAGFELPLLREDMVRACAAAGETQYFTRVVPFHAPVVTVLGVVGECVLTRPCVRAFTAHFDANASNRGALFRWPPAAAIWLDFCTGESHEPTVGRNAPPLLMIVQMLSGVFRPPGGGASQTLQRVQPRLISVASLHELVGDAGDAMTPPFYPDVVRRVTRRAGDGAAPLTAAALWDRFSSRERLMPAYEALHCREILPYTRHIGGVASVHPIEAL